MIKKPSENEIAVRENMRGGQGNVTIRHFFKKDEFTSKTRLCATLSIPPGAGIGMHQHEDEDEVYLVTKGTGLLDDGREQTAVTQGDAILTGGGASHAITNNGSDTLELVAVIMRY